MNAPTITPTTTTPPAFVGWWKPTGQTRWTQLSAGDNYDVAWTELLAALSSVRGGDSVVLKAAEDPNRPPPRYRQGGRRRL